MDKAERQREDGPAHNFIGNTPKNWKKEEEEEEFRNKNIHTCDVMFDADLMLHMNKTEPNERETEMVQSYRYGFAYTCTAMRKSSLCLLTKFKKKT